MKNEHSSEKSRYKLEKDVITNNSLCIAEN